MFLKELGKISRRQNILQILEVLKLNFSRTNFPENHPREISTYQDQVCNKDHHKLF